MNDNTLFLEHIPNIRSIKKLPSALKFSGFVKVSEVSLQFTKPDMNARS